MCFCICGDEVVWCFNSPFSGLPAGGTLGRIQPLHGKHKGLESHRQSEFIKMLWDDRQSDQPTILWATMTNGFDAVTPPLSHQMQVKLFVRISTNSFQLENGFYNSLDPSGLGTLTKPNIKQPRNHWVLNKLINWVLKILKLWPNLWHIILDFGDGSAWVGPFPG